jgi:hypothetical protein
MPRVYPLRAKRRAFDNLPTYKYAPRWVDADKYERVEDAPPDVKWIPMQGKPEARFTVLRTIGDFYRLIRDRDTGAVSYYKRTLDDVPAKSPAEQIDAEPEPLKQQRYHKGSQCWFVDTGDRWYLVKVADRTPNRITIASVTGFDSDRKCPWPYGELLEFPAMANNPLFMRLRKLSTHSP